MTPDIALSRLAQICVEHVQNFKEMPATREAVAIYVQDAVNVLREAIAKPKDSANGDPAD